MAVIYAIRQARLPKVTARKRLRFQVRPVLRGQLGRVLAGFTAVSGPVIVLLVVAFVLAGVGIGCAETAEHAAVAAFAPATWRHGCSRPWLYWAGRPGMGIGLFTPDRRRFAVARRPRRSSPAAAGAPFTLWVPPG